MKDLVIIGAGPAGMSAAVYAVRSGLDIEVIESNYFPGGQVLTTYEVDNYLGLPGHSGFDLGMKFGEHAKNMGISIKSANVTSLEKTDDGFSVKCSEEIISTKTVLVTTGAQNRKLDVPGEEKFIGKGISYCAACDGAFFKDKIVCVVGGSYTAVEDAIYLAEICEKVYVIHRRDSLRAGAFLEKRLFAYKNVEFVWNSTVKSINGEDALSSITVTSSEDREIPVSGVFVAVGTVPKTDLLKDLVELDKSGYVVANEDGKTSLSGLFVAGDLRTKPLRQIITAVSDGANAATSIWHYLLSTK